jgi:hypothetical protein
MTITGGVVSGNEMTLITTEDSSGSIQLRYMYGANPVITTVIKANGLPTAPWYGYAAGNNVKSPAVITSTTKAWGQIGYTFTVLGSNFQDSAASSAFYLNSLTCPLVKWRSGSTGVDTIRATVPTGSPRGYYHQIVKPDTSKALPCTTATSNFRVYKPEGF